MHSTRPVRCVRTLILLKMKIQSVKEELASHAQSKFLKLNSMKNGDFLLKHTYRLLIYLGFFLTLIGGTVLVLGFLGVIDLEMFAYGLSAGVRVVGTIAISGCLIGAIGSFGLEFNNN